MDETLEQTVCGGSLDGCHVVVNSSDNLCRAISQKGLQSRLNAIANV